MTDCGICLLASGKNLSGSNLSGPGHASENQCNIQLFRERLSEKKNVHATIPKCSLGHNKCSFH